MRDQREHVEVARHERLPAAHEERPAGPQHDRRRQHELQPVRQLLADQRCRSNEMPAHLQHDDRQRRARARSRTAASCRPARDWARLSARRQLRLERHAADRAGARARPGGSRDASGRCRSCLPAPARRRRCAGLEILRRIGHELGAAAGRAEVVGAAAAWSWRCGVVVRIDRHAADRIDGVCRRAPCGAACRVVGCAVRLIGVSGHSGRPRALT